MPLKPGQVLQSRYRVVSLLGQGGMGAVYQALDMRLNAPVALKEMVPQPGLDADQLAQLQQQFKQEAEILAQMNHPHLVSVTDYFTEGGNAYLVMKFIAGETLIERVSREGALLEGQVLEWARQLLDALSYCHHQGILHRDIKPQNVIVTPDERIVLVDFGLVKLWDPHSPYTRTAIRGAGTPEYAPPEQYDGVSGHTDPRSDLYSLGATLYHVLTGHAPPTATQRMANPSSFRLPRVLNSHLSSHIERLILKAMQPQPELRFQSAEEMKAAVEQGTDVSTRVSSPVLEHVPPKRARSTAGVRQFPRWVWGVGGSVILLLLCGAIAGVSLLPNLLPTSTGTQMPLEYASPSSTATIFSIEPTSTRTELPSTAEATVTSVPEPTSTSVPIPTHQPILLGSAANARLDFQSPPTGDIVLGSVPFRLSERVFKSQASPAPNDEYPTSIFLTTDLPRAYRVYLLLNTGNGFHAFSGSVIGEVRAYCDGTPVTVAELELGQDVREWHAAGNVVSSASRPQAVWSGSIEGFPDLTGHIDMLSLELPESCLRGHLTGLEVLDTSSSTVGSLDPSLNLVGVTVEYYR